MISGALLSLGAHPCGSGTKLNVIMYRLMLVLSCRLRTVSPIYKPSSPSGGVNSGSPRWIRRSRISGTMADV